jgi:hypothetical protein
MLTLVRQKTSQPAPNPHSQPVSELLPGPYPEPVPIPSLIDYLQPSSRTLVTKISNFRRYRFFSSYSSESLHARAHQEIPLPPPPCLAIPQPWHHLPAVFLHPLRRYFRHAAKCSSREVLLPLLGISRARRLRKNVRVEALCLPLVGKNLRETPHAVAGSQFQRRPPLPPPRPRRTRQTVINAGASPITVAFPSSPLDNQ